MDPMTRECCQIDIHALRDLLQALADPHRLALLVRLGDAGTPLTVSEVSECCGVHLSGVSRHLAILRRAGVVRAERRGREVYYALEASWVAAALRELAEVLERTERPERSCASQAATPRGE
jgi:ArsR family transcriptional regulator